MCRTIYLLRHFYIFLHIRKKFLKYISYKIMNSSKLFYAKKSMVILYKSIRRLAQDINIQKTNRVNHKL